MNDRQDFEEILKDCALWGGIILALISIWFSYDGLDQTVGNAGVVAPGYEWLAIAIGIVMAVIVTLLQFIFNSDFSRLSTTLKIIGFLSYIYSVWTNQLGISHLFGFSPFASWCVAFAFDVVPEALIAWAWDEDVQGDLIGNVFKGFASLRRGNKRGRKSDNKPIQTFSSQPSYRPVQTHQPKKGQGRSFQESHRHFSPESKKDDTQPKMKNFFGE